MRIPLRPLAALAILGALTASGVASAADKIAVRLDWTPWGVQSALHLANQKGVYAKHGLDVRLDDGNGSVGTVQIVGNGEYDVGHASHAPMIIARAKGLPIRAIAGFTRQNDIGLLVPKDSGIKSPGDLKGKKLAFSAGSLEAPFLDRFFAAGGLKRADVELLTVDAAAKAGTYMAGRVDGAFTSVPFLVANQQRPSTAVRFADAGLEFPSFGLVATEKTIAEKADALRRFVSVTAGAWAYIYDGHVDEAVKAMIAARPQAKLDAEMLRGQIESLREFAYTPATKDKPFGIMAKSDWDTALKTLAEAGLIDKAGDSAAYFTNDLIDERIVAAVAKGER